MHPIVDDTVGYEPTSLGSIPSGCSIFLSAYGVKDNTRGFDSLDSGSSPDMRSILTKYMHPIVDDTDGYAPTSLGSIPSGCSILQ